MTARIVEESEFRAAVAGPVDKAEERHTEYWYETYTRAGAEVGFIEYKTGRRPVFYLNEAPR